MTTITVQELQQDPAGMLDRVAAGERLLVIRDGAPVAEFAPLPQPLPTERPFGLCAGEFIVPDDFDAPLPDEILREFEGQ